MTEIVFFVFAAVALGGAFGVVMSRNPVGSLLFMVTTLGAIAGIFVLMEAHFLAAIQVLVYAGAIMVLFLFVIMLLNLGHDYQRDVRAGFWIILSFAVAGGLGGLLSWQFRGAEESPLYGYFGGASAMEGPLREEGVVGVIARPLFTEYVVPFELTGLLLLVAIVGAMVLAKRRV